MIHYTSAVIDVVSGRKSTLCSSDKPRSSHEDRGLDNVRTRSFSCIPCVAALVNDKIDGIIEGVIIDVVAGTGQIDPIDVVRTENVAAHRVAVSFQTDATFFVRIEIVAAQPVAIAGIIHIDTVVVVRVGIVVAQHVIAGRLNDELHFRYR